MKKCFLMILISGMAYSQVGINTTTPQATLDIIAKTTDGTKPEGLIAPRLTGDQIKSADAQYNAAQKGTLVYATSPVGTASTKTANITSEGYYYFNGSVWEKSDNQEDLRLVNGTSHITEDAGVNGTGTSAGSTNCVFIGPGTGNTNSGTENIGISLALENHTTGIRNIAIGFYAMRKTLLSINPVPGTTDDNIGVGTYAGGGRMATEIPHLENMPELGMAQKIQQ